MEVGHVPERAVSGVEAAGTLPAMLSEDVGETSFQRTFNPAAGTAGRDHGEVGGHEHNARRH